MADISFSLLLLPFLFCLFLFFALTRSETWEENFRRAFVWGAVGVLAVLSFVEIVDYLTAIDTGRTTPAGSSSIPTQGRVSNSEATMALAIGVIGLVITGMTGMALGAAWRAKDLSSNAETTLRKYQEAVEKSEEALKFFSSKTLAHFQALALKQSFPEERVLDVLISGVRAEERSESAQILGGLVNDPEFEEQLKRLPIPNGIMTYIRLLIDTRIELLAKSRLISVVAWCEQS